jgi:predicted acyl esterase
VWHASKLYDPYGFQFRVLEPANTPDLIMQALVPNQVFKFTWAEGLFGTYSSTGKLGSAFQRWIAQAAADAPLYDRPRCDASHHDTPQSTIEQDLAFRSPGCFVSRMTLPSLWAQSFDDGLFPPELAISMWRRMPDHRDNRLYLSMGGHGAPQAQPAAEADRLQAQIKFADHFLRARPLRMPRVVYWTRDPAVVVSAKQYVYPPGAWYRQTSGQWPPRSIRSHTYRLAANGTAVEGASAAAGSLPLAPLSSDERNDPVALTATSSTPIGTSPVQSLPATGFPGFTASFATAPLSSDIELSGPAVARLRWSPNSTDTQLVMKLFDRAPDGTMTMMTRGVTGVRGAAVGPARDVTVTGSDTSFLLRRGHRVVIWVMSGDIPYYRQYEDSGGGVLSEGSVSTLMLPLRPTPR